jgi:hypothetical protein
MLFQSILCTVEQKKAAACLAAASALMLGVACGDSSSDDATYHPTVDAGGSGGGSAGGAGGTAGSSTAVEPECLLEGGVPCTGASTDAKGNPATCIYKVEADLKDEAGAAVANFFVQVCGTSQCTAGPTDSSGHAKILPCQNIVFPAFEIPGKSQYVSCSVPVPQGTSSLGTFKVVALGAPGADISTSNAATYTSGGISVVVAAGTTVKVSTLDHPSADDKKFRAAVLPADNIPGLAASSPGLEVFVGLAPTGTTLSTASALTIPNTKQWAAGTAVQFYQQGFKVGAETAAPAKWTESAVADGVVSSDGATITTNSGQGITQLILVGVKKK